MWSSPEKDIPVIGLLQDHKQVLIDAVQEYVEGLTEDIRTDEVYEALDYISTHRAYLKPACDRFKLALEMGNGGFNTVLRELERICA